MTKFILSWPLRILLFAILMRVANSHNVLRRMRNTIEHSNHKEPIAPILSREIDLETVEGIEQVTKLILIKTDSLPNDGEEQIDGRYLNSLMETLYTGLRKPFKSVSADILGIFPSLEEIQVRCDKQAINTDLEKDESVRLKRNSSAIEVEDTSLSSARRSESNIDKDFSDETMIPNGYRSSVQVCKAVTNDCLSIEDLVQVLPPSVTTFDKAVVRICPIMLFRVMNNLCHKSRNPFVNDQIDDNLANGRLQEEPDGNDTSNHSVSYSLLLREKQKLNGDDLRSKKPQKLHKKLKTQTAYKGKGSVATLQQQGNVDEQLLKIRLKLTEPSIEKVWIFSLLFVILSIVVSMGGLIVLPFVRKTTRRRILTLFEGLAVGGLSGSATLHMFPQAFGLVDENYHKYFWRIFVVFFGIYLCYLCERAIKILKVLRTRMKRRSRASLDDVNTRFGFPYMEDAMSASRSKFSKVSGLTNGISVLPQLDSGPTETDNPSVSRGNSDVEFTDFHQPNATRQRLVRCLKAVRQQFSPVYAVHTIDENAVSKDDSRGIKSSSTRNHRDGPRRREIGSRFKSNVSKLFNFKPIFRPSKDKRNRKRLPKIREHDLNRLRPINSLTKDRVDMNRGYIQHRLSRVGNLAAERQDNAVRMSVDTVAWMIVFGDAVLNVIDGLSIGAAFERNILAGISISVAVMLEEVTHRLGTFAVLIRAGMSMQQSLLWTFLSACALFPGLIVGILLSDATEDATPYIFCAAGGIFLYMALVDVMKEMNRSIENAMRKDIKSTLQIFALQNLGIILAVIFLSFLALYEQAMDFEEYQQQYKQS